MGVAIMVWQILMDRYSKGEFHVLLKWLKLFDHELFFKHIATRYFDFSQRCLFCLIICCIQQFHWLIILSNISSDNSSLELSFVQLPKRKKKKKKENSSTRPCQVLYQLGYYFRRYGGRAFLPQRRNRSIKDPSTNRVKANISLFCQ